MRDKINPLVSIITPAFNAERFIGETVKSVLNQTYKNWEMLIILDSKSTDATPETVSAISKGDPRINLMTTDIGNGVAINRNHGIDRAKGEYIAFLDSDDVWLPEKLERQLAFALSNDASFTFHSFTPIDVNGKIKGQPRRACKGVTYRSLLDNNSIGCLTVMLKREFLGEKRFKDLPHEDFALWLDLLREGGSAQALNADLARYRIVPGSRSNNKFKAAFSRFQVLRSENLGFWKMVEHMAAYAMNSLGKRM